jgi:hypothetical protein
MSREHSIVTASSSNENETDYTLIDIDEPSSVTPPQSILKKQNSQELKSRNKSNVTIIAPSSNDDDDVQTQIRHLKTAVIEVTATARRDAETTAQLASKRDLSVRCRTQAAATGVLIGEGLGLVLLGLAMASGSRLPWNACLSVIALGGGICNIASHSVERKLRPFFEHNKNDVLSCIPTYDPTSEHRHKQDEALEAQFQRTRNIVDAGTIFGPLAGVALAAALYTIIASSTEHFSHTELIPLIGCIGQFMAAAAVFRQTKYGSRQDGLPSEQNGIPLTVLTPTPSPAPSLPSTPTSSHHNTVNSFTDLIPHPQHTIRTVGLNFIERFLNFYDPPAYNR